MVKTGMLGEYNYIYIGYSDGIVSNYLYCSPSFSIFVGDLDPNITDDKLEDFFLKKYRSVKGGKVMYDDHGDSR